VDVDSIKVTENASQENYILF